MKIRNLKPEDLAEVKKLCDMVHWPLTIQDIRRLYELESDGWFCAETDDQYVGQAMGITTGSLGCLGMVIIHEDYRRKGTGTALTTHALNYLRNRGAQTIRLDATPEAHNIYRKLGFSDEFPVYHYIKGVAYDKPPLTKILEAKPVRAGDLEGIIEFDKLLLGVSRAKILKSLFNDSRTFLLRQGNETQGYVMCRGTNRLHWLGPFVANDVPSAEKLLQQVLTEFSDREIRLGVPVINSSAIKLFHRYGFRAEFEITRMRYGLNLMGENTQSIFAEAGHEKT